MQRVMIEIDEDSGFCFGVVNAIKKAEDVCRFFLSVRFPLSQRYNQLISALTYRRCHLMEHKLLDNLLIHSLMSQLHLNGRK